MGVRTGDTRASPKGLFANTADQQEAICRRLAITNQERILGGIVDGNAKRSSYDTVQRGWNSPSDSSQLDFSEPPFLGQRHSGWSGDAGIKTSGTPVREVKRDMRRTFLVLLAISLILLPLFFEIRAARAETITLYGHGETTTINGYNHYTLSTNAINGPAYQNSHKIDTTAFIPLISCVWSFAGIESLTACTWNVREQINSDLYGIYAQGAIRVRVLKSDDSVRSTLFTSYSTSEYQLNGWTLASWSYSFAGYTVVDNTDYLEIDFGFRRAVVASTRYGYSLVDDTGKAQNSRVEGFQYTPLNNHYYFNFQHHDVDNNVIDSLVSWELYNGSQKLIYGEGESTLSSGTYTLMTYKENHLLDSRNISTSSYGNSTVSVNIPYKQHSNVADGYVCMNNTISSITVESQTATNLTFSINATTIDAQCYVGTSGSPQDAWLNGNNFTSYTYISTTTPKYLYFAYTENGTYSFTFNPTLPPTPSTGGPSGGPATSFSKRLRITVTNHDEPVQQANVTVYGVPEDPATLYYQFSDVFGRVTFRLKAGVYKILVQHDTLGNRHRTVNLDANYDLTIEYTDADESTGEPLSILPQWDLTSEQGILFIAIPIGAVVLYAGSIALRSKRKWKYSYL